MAFQVQDLSLCTPNAEGGAIYSYISATDSLATITDSKYFGLVASEFNVNDLIYICDATELQSGKAFYFVINKDIDNKIVGLAPLIGQSGSVSSWADIDASVATSLQLAPNMGYRVVKAGASGSILTLILPDVPQLSVGNTIMFSNYSGQKTNITQNASQSIFFPNNLQTTEGATKLLPAPGTGYLQSSHVSDSFTLIVMYNNTVNPNAPLSPPDQSATYGTEFNINNITGQISYY